MFSLFNETTKHNCNVSVTSQIKQFSVTFSLPNCHHLNLEWINIAHLTDIVKITQLMRL